MTLFVPDVPSHLSKIVRDKSAILIAGAGVSMAATNGASMASWKGLLRHGVQHCKDFGKPRLQNEMAQKYLTILDSNDTDSWLSVATLIERKLKYPDNREWAKWLSETIGQLGVRNPNIIEAVLTLELPIITTNYDSLFETPTLSRPLHSLTWTTPYFDQLFFEHPEKYIFHLHGHYGFPDSVVLGVASYAKILGHDFTQIFTKLVSLRQGMVFIGYGAGLDDPNFSQLLKFVDEQGSTHRHYILVKESELANYEKFDNIYAVAYGTAHDDLPIFLRTLPFGRERYIYARPRGYAELLKPGLPFQDLAYCPKMVPVALGSYKRPTGAEITIDRSFAISESVISIEEWDVFASESNYRNRKFIGNTSRSDMPVVGISYYDALEYVEWLSQVSGRSYRLPSEAEWEYVANGGKKTRYWWGDAPNTAYANYRESKLFTTSPVRNYRANPFGVYDMNGNVWEWCADNFARDERHIPPNGSAFVTTDNSSDFRFDERILKGGCFYYDADYMTTFARIHLEEDAVFNSVGVRVVRDMGDVITPGSEYFIISLAGPYAVTAVSADEIGLKQFSMANNQVWKLVPGASSGDLFSFENVETGRHLQYDDNPVDYALLAEPRRMAAPRHEWQIKPALGGYMISAGTTSKVLDAEGGRSRKLPDLILFEQHGNFNQIWNFLTRK